MTLIRRSLVFLALTVGLCPALAACNALTGADDLVIKDGDGRGGNGSSNGSGNGAGAGSGETTGATMGEPMAAATGVNLREVALYQGVKRPLMAGGARADSDVPIVQGRDALLRVFYDVIEGYNGGAVTARLTIDGQPPLDVTQPLAGSSSDAAVESTINFDVPAAMMVPGMAYRIELLQPREQSAGDNPAALYPAQGSDPIDVNGSPSALHVKLIPISYAADGTNRLPDTSAAQLKRYRDLFYGMYPLTSLEISVHAPVQWDGALDANGTGWDTLLNSLADFRAQENAPDNVYYYGIFEPAASVAEFCNNGCVAGLGFVTTVADAFGRTSIGIGYPGEIAIETAVHEIGHNHGRNHAPCGDPAGPDQGYPHAGGKIGTWGYDILARRFFPPTTTADVMGYCQPIWTSDYTFRRLFERVQAVDGMNVVIPPEMLDRTWERVQIDTQGNATFLDPVKLHRPPMADATPVELESPSGTEIVQGQLYRYDHLDGGVVLWPRSSAAFASAKIQLAGQLITAIK